MNIFKILKTLEAKERYDEVILDRGVFIADYRVDDNSYEVTELFGDMNEYEDAELLAMINRNNQKPLPDFTNWRK